MSDRCICIPRIVDASSGFPFGAEIFNGASQPDGGLTAPRTVPYVAQMSIQTPSDLIRELGGWQEVAKITRRKPGAVSNWHKRGIPDDYATITRLIEALSERGIAPPNWLTQREGA